jgi:hypothetical protein
MNHIYVQAYRERVEQHRELVAQQCRELGVPELQARIHDLSKYSPQEQPFYIIKFTIPRLTGAEPLEQDEVNFRQALQHHYECNPHRPEHWRGESMPGHYIREMAIIRSVSREI